MAENARKLVIRITTGFGLGGGFGIPALFALIWQVLSRIMSRDSDAYMNAMVWLESFRGMFWPSSILMAAHAPGDDARELTYLLALVLLNVVLYTVIGLVVALVLHNRVAQTLVALLLLAGMYGLNAYWSEHLASFFIAAILLVLLFGMFFWKFDLKQSRSE